MGGNPYSGVTYARTVGASRGSGKDHAFSKSISDGVRKATAHPDLDPKWVNKAGIQIRECRDSELNPMTTPIIAAFDLIGSNSQAASVAQDKLQLLFGVLAQQGVCDDPQIAVAGYGDAYCDNVPLQISQFESDNRIDAQLDNIYLESGGGGNGGETATLLWYFVNKYAQTDSYEKRGKKGYFFMIADECALPITANQVAKFIGGEADSQMLSAEANAAALMDKWNVFVLLVPNSSAAAQDSARKYAALFGEERVLTLDDTSAMIETIAAAIGAIEDTVSASEIKSVLLSAGASDSAASTALAAVSGLYALQNKKGEVLASAPDLGL